MQQQRNTVLIMLILFTVFMFFTWSGDKNAAIQAQNQPEVTIQAPKTDNIVKVSTDLYDLEIGLDNGDILKADLKDQKQEIDSAENFHLLRISGNFKYFASSNLVSAKQEDQNIDPTQQTSAQFRYMNVKYSSEKSSYVMSKPQDLDGRDIQEYCSVYRASRNPDQKTTNKDSINPPSDNSSLVVTLTGTTSDGISVNKIFAFERCSHEIRVSFEVSNLSQPLRIAQISSLEQSVNDPDLNSGMFGTSAYRGMAYSTSDTKYQKESFTDIGELKQPENVHSSKGGWISMIQHYFVAAWIGAENTSNTIFSYGKDGDETAVVGIRSQDIAINPGEKATLSNILWMGPKDIHEMKKVSPHLELTVDYGWLSFLSIWLYYALEFIHQVFPNWGVAIIILTILVRSLMYPLTKKQYVSMAKMRILTPKMNELKELYKDDRQKLSMAMMELYQKEKVNPLGGCLPILIQMPIFIALYWTFMESTELRHSAFCLWIQDLSAYDPYFVLPILMGVTMLLIQKMSPTTITDPMQKKIMMLMPIIFTGLFCTFPAGLTLYWLVSNIFTIAQQFVIFRALEKKGLSMKNPVK